MQTKAVMQLEQFRNSAMSHRDQAGFTLIELLIVIGIIGTLAAVLLPRILETDDVAKQSATEATMLQLSTACDTYKRATGVYPPDNFTPIKKGAAAIGKKDNGQNSPIESFLVMVSQNKTEGSDLGGLRKQFTNTDGDQNGAPMPLLDGMTERMELADAWGTPLAYFTKLTMQKPQLVVTFEGEAAVQVKAKQRPDGSYYGAQRFQFLSAGKDLTFGTDDDIVWPSN